MLGAVVADLEAIGLACLEHAKGQLHSGELVRGADGLLVHGRLIGIVGDLVVGAVVRVLFVCIGNDVKGGTGQGRGLAHIIGRALDGEGWGLNISKVLFGGSQDVATVGLA